MEGIVSKEVLIIQAECMELGGCTLSLDDWTKGLTVKLLEVTHGQWSYRHMQVHNVVGVVKAAQKLDQGHCCKSREMHNNNRQNVTSVGFEPTPRRLGP